MPTIRRAVRVIALSVVAAVVVAAPAGAQQLVDAGHKGDGSGGLAFVLMTIMVMGIWGALFSMDRVRRRRQASAE
ncbi:MAG TPA: hypothetical protein VMX12_09375 [Acidimicrobiia bacterium]|nr:hypothetical protein [Acidimicrobiia bacterium]